MRKPLSGKRLFEAMGRRAYSQGMPIHHQRTSRHQWPLWAQEAWVDGWLMQAPKARP